MKIILIQKKYLMLMKIYIYICLVNFVLSSDSEADTGLTDPKSA